MNRKTKKKEERKIGRNVRFANTRVRADKESGKTDGRGRKQWKLKPEEEKWLALEAAFLVDCRPVYLTRVLTRIVRRGSWHLGHAHPKAFSKVLRALHCGVFTATAAHDRQDRRRRPVVGKPAARTTEVREEDGRWRKGKRGLMSRDGKV